MIDDEERRLIVAYTGVAVAYSSLALKLDNARMFLPKAEFRNVYRQVELARIRCEMARLDLEAHRAAKQG